MRHALRWIVVAVLMIDGLVDLLGATKGLGWVAPSPLTRPVSAGMGIASLAAAMLCMATGLLLVRSIRCWWMVGAAALIAESPAAAFARTEDASVQAVHWVLTRRVIP